ncbi:MAG TPA: nucleotidyltransferase [Noviherbaspirillum sp.]|nr:nucleotidyltransferase [Noviherbaspirillum sp.]
MPNSLPISCPGNDAASGTTAFYRHVLEILNAAGTPYLVGGAYALNRYTGINRQTRDLDLFIRRRDVEQIRTVLQDAGYNTELTFPHWLAKIHLDGAYIDLIFSSGNGIAEVDDAWFEYANEAPVLGVPTKICPPEEIIWSKAFIMERERYDGADIIHLLHACGDRLDWQRLFRRFDAHWRILLSHLILFGFVYPSRRALIPPAIMEELLNRLRNEIHSTAPQHDVCLGTLLSREQYLNDVGQQGLQDARIAPVGNMSIDEIAIWTQAIPPEHNKD